MGLFDKLFKKNTAKPIIENQENNISEEITPVQTNPFDIEDHNLKLVLQYWGEHDYGLSEEVDKLLEPCDIRIERLAKVAELCIPADSNDKLYYASKGYLWAGAQYRDKAIEYLEKLIDAGGTWSFMPIGYRESSEIEIAKLNIIADLHIDLGKCYEAEYEFDKAMRQYCIANSMFPGIPRYVHPIVDIYVKKNELNTALKVLLSAKETVFYSENFFKESIDKKLLDIEKKIAKGYVYRPRKKTK